MNNLIIVIGLLFIVCCCLGATTLYFANKSKTNSGGSKCPKGESCYSQQPQESACPEGKACYSQQPQAACPEGKACYSQQPQAACAKGKTCYPAGNPCGADHECSRIPCKPPNPLSPPVSCFTYTTKTDTNGCYIDSVTLEKPTPEGPPFCGGKVYSISASSGGLQVAECDAECIKSFKYYGMWPPGVGDKVPPPVAFKVGPSDSKDGDTKYLGSVQGDTIVVAFDKDGLVSSTGRLPVVGAGDQIIFGHTDQ